MQTSLPTTGSEVENGVDLAPYAEDGRDATFTAVEKKTKTPSCLNLHPACLQTYWCRLLLVLACTFFFSSHMYEYNNNKKRTFQSLIRLFIYYQQSIKKITNNFLKLNIFLHLLQNDSFNYEMIVPKCFFRHS